MKKILNIKFIIIAFAMLFASCDLDINESPNNPADVPVKFVLPAAQASVVITIGGEYLNLGGFWAQYWTQSPDAQQYQQIDNYNLKTTDYENQYNELYSGALKNLEIVREKALKENENGYYFVATALRAYVLQLMSDLYSKAPYTEILKGEMNTTPKWDEGSLIYESIIKELDVALAKDIKSSIIENDMFFGNDLKKWVQFINSLKLKIYMRQSYTAKNHKDDILKLLAENNFLTKDASVASSYFTDEESKRNPWYEINCNRLSSGTKSINHVASHTFMSYLKFNNDVRIDKIFNKPVKTPTTHESNYQGAGKKGMKKTTSRDDYSTVNIGATDPAYIMLASEVQFLISEAYVRYGNNETKAKAAYLEGIKASFIMHGLTNQDTTYTNTGKVYAWKPLTGNIENDIEQIMVQKWVALAKFLCLESFFEINRTHYPKVSSVLGNDPLYVPGQLTSPIENSIGAGNFAKRVFYPQLSISRNPNAPTQVGSINVKVWWDLKN